MIRLMDATLIMLDSFSPSGKSLVTFCEYMQEIGILDLEISKFCYHQILDYQKVLPEKIHFYLHLEYNDDWKKYPGVYKYVRINQRETEENTISKIQINDIKEILKIGIYGDCNYLYISGLDDILMHTYHKIFMEIRNTLKKTKLIFAPENTYFCATASAVEWILAGGNEVSCSFCGIGNRAATEEVYLAIHVTKRFKPNQILSTFVEMKHLFEEITGQKVSDYKAVIGTKIFEVESGIHVDGMIKNTAVYTAYPPEKVGLETKIMIGKHSGSNSIISKCSTLSLEKPSENDMNQMLLQIRKLSMVRHSNISDEEFVQIYKEVSADEEKN